ncbi:hypothetical protein Pcinc_008763 [Petrolisthes cinctipes]|uniref:Uncharacterized protein n=1 Tax=Petrolisthes cinctipes TaxID=88211 RepID=A0AAE1G8B0_PETCI|nr:hypothetical protein Pcinc_008763 [Petrolisthes cinctipes]
MVPSSPSPFSIPSTLLLSYCPSSPSSSDLCFSILISPTPLVLPPTYLPPLPASTSPPPPFPSTSHPHISPHHSPFLRHIFPSFQHRLSSSSHTLLTARHSTGIVLFASWDRIFYLGRFGYGFYVNLYI